MNLPEWVDVWRRGIAPLLTDDQLSALRLALEDDDPRLIQSYTTFPPPFSYHYRKECTAGCPLGFTGMSDGLETVGEVIEYFGRVCVETDKAMGYSQSVGAFFDFWDYSRRDVAVAGLLAEVRLAEAGRRAAFVDEVAPVTPEEWERIKAI